MGSNLTRFYDRHHAFEFLVGREIGLRLVADPALVETAKSSLEHHFRDDPHSQYAYALWSELLHSPVEEIARKLSQNDEEGDLIRQTRPPFIALDPAKRVSLLEEARCLVGHDENT